MNEEIKKFLEEVLAKNGGVITANALEDIMKKYGSELTEELTQKWEAKFGAIENTLEAKNLDKGDKVFKNFAEFVLAVKEYDKVENTNKLKALETGVQGEYLIRPEWVNGIFGVAYESNPFLQMAQQFPLLGNSASITFIKDKNRTAGNIWGGVVGYWLEEGTAPTLSDMKLGRMNLRLHDYGLLIAATDNIMEDSPEGMANLINKGFGVAIDSMYEDVFLNGNGVGKPLGVLNSAAKIEAAKLTGQSAGTIVSQNLTTMVANLPKQSKKNAVWIYGSDPAIYSELVNCKVGTSDFPAFIPAGALSEAQPVDRILGRPAYESEHLSSALGTVNDIVLVDPTQYAVAYKRTLTPALESSAHLYFDKFQQAFRMKIRIDGQPMWDTYLTEANSKTKSPIVTLATRA